MKVHEFSTHHFIAISPQHTIRDCLESFLQNRSDIACVTDEDGFLEGIVTKYSIYRLLLAGHALDDPVAPAIRRQVVSFYQHDSLYHAKDVLLKNHVAHGVVLDREGRVVGVLGKADIIRGFLTNTHFLLNQLTALIENLQDAVVSIDTDYRVMTYNKAAERLFGIPREQVIGQFVQTTFSELYEYFLAALEHATATESRRICLPSATVIGSFIPLQEWDRINGAMAVLKDITSYEKVAKELETTKKLERTLDSALQLSYDGVLITDEHGVITKVNPAFLDIYRTDEDAAVGKPAAVIAPELPIQEVLLNQKPMEGEIREIRGKKCIVTMHPIIRNGKCEGAIAKIIFQKLDQWKDVFRKLEQLESELNYYRSALNRATQRNAFDRIVSNNAKIAEIKREAYLASQGFSTILLTGESGTGKELFAEAIHEESGRPGNFVKINCAAIPAELLESEFFGYAEGAFTGARKGGKPGKFELADRGTLFLDEIGDMPLALQAKLLRVLQGREFERIGDTKTRRVDVRIVAATNKNLQQLVREGKFREDLYYRINVIRIHIPPLRERLDDIPLLCEHFIKKLNQKMNRRVIGITPETLRILQQYHWPGNVRELENVLERAFHFSTGVWIEPKHLPEDLQKEAPLPDVRRKPSHGPSASEYRLENLVLADSRCDLLAQAEKQLILKALELSAGNRSLAAQRLGISRAALYQKLKKYNIQTEVRFRSGSS